jgi:uncharacterized DUF497 family protein
MAYALETAFEWDPAKDEANRRKHGLGFEEAAELFTSDEDYLVVLDQSHRGTEERFIGMGTVARGVIVVVWMEPEEGRVRMISAREATRREIRLYQQSMDGRP